MYHLVCNALVHVIYCVVSGQYSYTLPREDCLQLTDIKIYKYTTNRIFIECLYFESWKWKGFLVRLNKELDITFIYSPLSLSPTVSRLLIFPVDHTRVCLRDGDPDALGSDYINANLITVSKYRYINVTCRNIQTLLKPLQYGFSLYKLIPVCTIPF